VHFQPFHQVLEMKMNWKKKSPIRYANKKAPACVKGIHPSLSLSCPMVPGV
jgi:hypothetical protein